MQKYIFDNAVISNILAGKMIKDNKSMGSLYYEEGIGNYYVPDNFIKYNDILYVGSKPQCNEHLLKLQSIGIKMVVTGLELPLTSNFLPLNIKADCIQYIKNDKDLFDNIDQIDFLHVNIPYEGIPNDKSLQNFLIKAKQMEENGNKIYIHSYSQNRRANFLACCHLIVNNKLTYEECIDLLSGGKVSNESDYLNYNNFFESPQQLVFLKDTISHKNLTPHDNYVTNNDNNVLNNTNNEINISNSETNISNSEIHNGNIVLDNDNRTTNNDNLVDNRTTDNDNLVDNRTTNNDNLVDNRTTDNDNLVDNRTTDNNNLVDNQ